jgi:hypothetical protein
VVVLPDGSDLHAHNSAILNRHLSRVYVCVCMVEMLVSHQDPIRSASAEVVNGVQVIVQDVSGVLQLETDESYKLHVPVKGNVEISSLFVLCARQR